jgi:type IV pilus assembly protein PilE
MDTPSYRTGLTLLELMLVLAISTILLSIAYPVYTDYAQRARRTEAITALQMIALAQERLHTVRGQYAAQLTDLSLEIPAWRAGATEQGYYQLALVAQTDTQTYLVTATANGIQTRDLACQQFWLNQLGQRGATDHTGAASISCW